MSSVYSYRRKSFLNILLFRGGSSFCVYEEYHLFIAIYDWLTASWSHDTDLHSTISPVAYVGALQARLVSERSRKRCACGGVGTPRCTWAMG